MTEHQHHQHYNGTKDRAANRSPYKQLVTIVAEMVATLDLSIGESDRHIHQVVSHDYNISLSPSWCHKSMKDAIDTGKIVSRQKIDGVYIPYHLEVRIVFVIKRLRHNKLQVFPDDVMSWATHLMNITKHEHNFLHGRASGGGIVNFFTVPVSRRGLSDHLRGHPHSGVRLIT
jgi:hypothetical protein